MYAYMYNSTILEDTETLLHYTRTNTIFEGGMFGVLTLALDLLSFYTLIQPN